MNAIIQGLNSYAGLFSIFMIIIGAYFTSKAMSKSKANSEVSETQQRLIDTMKEEIDVLRRKTDDINKENAKLKLTIDTICMALKIQKGLVISIQGEFVTIDDRNGRTTSTRIHDQK